MRRPACLCLSLSLALVSTGCRRGADAEAEGAKATSDDGDIVIDDAQEPEIGEPDLPSYETYELAKGDNISKITRDRYGSSHYSRVVLLHNDLRPAQANSLKIGKVIKTPDIATIYQDEGLMDVVPDGCNALLAARRAFIVAEQDVEAAYGDEEPSGDLELSPRASRALAVAVEQLDAAIEGFEVDHEQIVNPPRMLLDELREARGLVGKLADGTARRFKGGEIHKHLGNATAYAIIWSRADYS